MRINAIPADLMPRAVAFDAAAYALRGKLLETLSGSSAASPVDVEKLYPLGAVDQVQACLMSLHRSGEVQCVHIASAKAERSMWWRSGNVALNTDWYGIREGRKSAPAEPKVAVKRSAKRVVRRISPRSQKVKDAIAGSPGILRPDLIEVLKTDGIDPREVSISLTSLINTGHVRTEGKRGAYRFFMGVVA